MATPHPSARRSPRALQRRAARALVLAALALVACGGGSRGKREDPDGGAPPPPTAAEGGEQTLAAFVDILPRCDIYHRGLLVDLGTEAAIGRLGWHVSTPENLTSTEHDGAHWARVYDRRLELQVLLSDEAPVFVAMRVIGRDAKSAVVSLDGHDLGTLAFGKGDIVVASTRPTALPVAMGLHHLGIRFRGRQKAGADPFAELDWVRVGVPDDLGATYGAPTVHDVRTPAAELGGVPHRSIGLRAPASVRCGIAVPRGARVRAAVGMMGDGEATADIAVRVDGSPRQTVRSVTVTGGASATWTDIDVPLDEFVGKLVNLELVASKTTGTGRLLFGDPELVVPAVPAPTTPKARAAVVVVLDGVDKSDLPPWSDHDTPHLPTLTELARTAVVFDRHRAASTLVAASVASLLTGTPPLRHGLADATSRLPPQPTLGSLAREASVRAAMFTGVPTTFAAFGFDPGWDTFEQYPPHGERLATAPIDDAALWLEEAAKSTTTTLFALIHARGGHPPWEVTPKEAALLPPADYAGGVNPRTAAEAMARARKRKLGFDEKDRTRLEALFQVALADQDRALGRLLSLLDEAGHWDDTLLVVTGDVASGRHRLFGDGLDPDEALFDLPLYVHFPGGAHGPRRVDKPTEVYDVTRTLLDVLGIQPSSDMLGGDLATVALAPEREVQEPRVAIFEDRYSARWGDAVLVGDWEARPRLCRFDLDATCSFDWLRDRPLLGQLLFRGVVAFYGRYHPQARPRTPLTLDSETAASLKVWGSYD